MHINVLFKPKVLWLGMDDCHFTWEHEKDVPTEIIKEYEESATVAVNEVSRQTMGQSSSILNVTSNDWTDPKSKQPKTERIVINEDDG